ncbi:Hypothetical protein MVR_LOCUS132 [uncultured virus]|nr:Hypothetical protein MVR_LOCUS132 [uncultured virus]
MPNLSFKFLNTKHLDIVTAFLQHYYNSNVDAIDSCCLVTKDLMSWILSNDHLSLALIYNTPGCNIIIGFVTAITINTLIDSNINRVAYINLLCIHPRLRRMGMTSKLTTKLVDVLTNNGIINYAFVTSSKLTNIMSNGMTISGPKHEFTSYYIPVSIVKDKYRAELVKSSDSNDSSGISDSSSSIATSHRYGLDNGSLSSMPDTLYYNKQYIISDLSYHIIDHAGFYNVYDRTTDTIQLTGYIMDYKSDVNNHVVLTRVFVIAYMCSSDDAIDDDVNQLDLLHVTYKLLSKSHNVFDHYVFSNDIPQLNDEKRVFRKNYFYTSFPLNVGSVSQGSSSDHVNQVHVNSNSANSSSDHISPFYLP